MGVILFMIAAFICAYRYQSSNKHMKDTMRKNNADPNSYSKSDDYYR